MGTEVGACGTVNGSRARRAGPTLTSLRKLRRVPLLPFVCSDLDRVFIAARAWMQSFPLSPQQSVLCSCPLAILTHQYSCLPPQKGKYVYVYIFFDKCKEEKNNAIFVKEKAQCLLYDCVLVLLVHDFLLLKSSYKQVQQRWDN